jgi:hypothetical protein
MPLNNTIVSYSNVVKPFGGQDQFLAKTHDAATKVLGDPAKVNAAMDDLKDGLDLWRESEINPKVLHTPRHSMTSLLQTHVARQASQENKLVEFLLKVEAKILECFEVRFSASDWPEWAASFFTWQPNIKAASFPAAKPAADPIPNNFSICMLGDFGTGLYGAPACANSIVNGPDRYNLMLHLGDVYYSATSDEVQSRFFEFWPRMPNAINRTLNGNHEMYNGGINYFGEMLKTFEQQSSYFAMQNDNWVLAFLDTAFNADVGGAEGVLDDTQMRWLSGIVKDAGAGRQLALFSHHQPYSLVESNNGGNLISQMEKFGLADRIFAWYWGHEHRCLLYDQHPKHHFRGRCAGHAGFPETRPDLSNADISPDFGSQWRRLKSKDPSRPDGWIYDTNNLYIPGFETLFAPNGFMRLEFNGRQLVEFVRTPDNSNVWLKELV